MTKQSMHITTPKYQADLMFDENLLCIESPEPLEWMKGKKLYVVVDFCLENEFEFEFSEL